MLLLEPLDINGLHLANRVIMLATHLGYCVEDGLVNNRLIEFYKARAKFQPGLIMIGGCYTDSLARSGPTMIGISEDTHIPGLEKLVDAIHEYDVPAAAQLYHAGRYSHPLFLGTDPVSASAEPSRLFRSTPRPLSKKEIIHTVENFGRAAARAKVAGFDAVEIIGSAGYLINQFLAKATNKRKDEYNGDLKARARFALEVIESIRSHVAKDYPIFYRLSGDDFVAKGNSLKENKMLAPWLVEAGVDCLNVTGGWHETRVPQTTMDVPRGHFAYLAEAISEVVDIPVVACNRINSPSVAESILQRGKAKLIGMSRGFIADPEFMEKVRTGREHEIRNCIACNLGCLDKVFRLEPVICSINPFAGYELERELGPRSTGKIAVVGGGPSGMEVARVLTLRGFSVTLFEKENQLGGLLRLLSRVPLRGEYASYVVHMQRELKRLGVSLKLGHEATAVDLQAGAFDHIVLATGMIASAPPIDGVEGPHVTSAFDILSSGGNDLGRVSVIGGESIGCHVALYAAGRANSVDLFVLEDRIGADIGISTRWVILKALKERGVQIHEQADISQITSKYVMVNYGDAMSMIEADMVVVATSPDPRTRLLEKLRKIGFPINTERLSVIHEASSVTPVGSVNGPMNLLECIHDAFEFANNLEI